MSLETLICGFSGDNDEKTQESPGIEPTGTPSGRLDALTKKPSGTWTLSATHWVTIWLLEPGPGPAPRSPQSPAKEGAEAEAAAGGGDGQRREPGV